MSKRSYGTGSAVYLASNKWELRYKPAWSPRRQTKRVDGGTTAAEKKRVLRLLDDWVRELDKLSKPPVDLSIDTLHDLLIADYRRHDRETTADTSRKFKKHLCAYFANDDMKDLSDAPVEEYIDFRKDQKAANGTINREVSWLHRSMVLARKRKLTTAVFDWERLDERASIRQGFITRAEYITILQELPSHLKMLWCFAYHWGIRKGEMLKLQWAWVLPYLSDDEPIIKVPGFDTKSRQRITKSGEPHTLPLYAPEMREFLKAALSSRNPACPYIFQYRGRRLKSPRTGFQNARTEVGLDGVMIHDLRRTAIRNMIRAGIDKKRAREISGHLTDSIFDRYDIHTEDDARETGRTMRQFMENEKQKHSTQEQLGVELGVGQKGLESLKASKLLN